MKKGLDDIDLEKMGGWKNSTTFKEQYAELPDFFKEWLNDVTKRKYFMVLYKIQDVLAKTTKCFHILYKFRIVTGKEYKEYFEFFIEFSNILTNLNLRARGLEDMGNLIKLFSWRGL